eukprot:TRINITY_DN13776_c0_g1_i2.p1 TRINITY_DN13776_c0_g1~~TRINITY_DN13776_c0_g1_i2.p1  ORF type:complete len:836 (-),score=130.19 TRINITY_DN13776_c0_g1_i2:620-3127(-)
MISARPPSEQPTCSADNDAVAAPPKVPLPRLIVPDDDIIEAEPEAVTPAGTGARNEPVSGSLSRRKGSHRSSASPGLFASATAGGCAHNIFWQRRHYRADSEALQGWATLADMQSGQTPLEVIPLVTINTVTCKVRDLTLTLKDQTAVLLRADNPEGAEKWTSTLREFAAAKLRDTLPHDWDVIAMLSGINGCLAKVSLRAQALATVQNLVDQAFLCKYTKDRRGNPLPLRLHVLDVVGVQNAALWAAYTESKAKMQARLEEEASYSSAVRTALPREVLTAGVDAMLDLGPLDTTLRENWLFHGTTEPAIEGITNREFRLDMAGTHRGTMYGKGVYLAECSTKADEYAEQNDGGLCHMLLCKAMVGHCLVDSEANPDGAELAARCLGGYDSLVGDRLRAVGTFREFVFFNTSLVYPAYIVKYRRVRSEELFSSIGSNNSTAESQVALQRLAPYVSRLAKDHPEQIVAHTLKMTLCANAWFVLPYLVRGLRSKIVLVRRNAVVGLWLLASFNVGRENIPTSVAFNKELVASQETPITFMALPHLTESLQDPDSQVRADAVSAIGYLFEHAAPAVKAVVDKLQDDSFGVRMAAAESLGRIGRPAAVATQTLLECLSDAGIDLVVVVVTSLGCVSRHGDEEVLARLRELVANPDSRVRCAAIMSLSKLCDKQEARAILEEKIKDESPKVREAALAGLAEIKAIGRDTLCEVAALIEDKDDRVRKQAVKTLAKVDIADEDLLKVQDVLRPIYRRLTIRHNMNQCGVMSGGARLDSSNNEDAFHKMLRDLIFNLELRADPALKNNKSKAKDGKGKTKRSSQKREDSRGSPSPGEEACRQQ